MVSLKLTCAVRLRRARLPKMASARGLRNKSTRMSSPATFSGKEDSAPHQVARAKDSPKTMLDMWIEPPLRHPAPSFEDNKGLERVGVLEHMVPLGQPPTQKLLQKLKLVPPKLSQRTTPFQIEEVTTPTNGFDRTETASPAEPMRRSESAQTEEPFMRPSSGRTLSERVDEDDYKPSDIVHRSPMRATPPQNRLPVASVSPSYPTPQQIPVDHIKVHIEDAIHEAEKKNTPSLVPGLRKLRDDADDNPALWTVLDAVLQKSPSPQQFRTFRRYIKSGISRNLISSTTNTAFPSSSQQNNGYSRPTPTKVVPSTNDFPVTTFTPLPNLPSPNSTSKLPSRTHLPPFPMASSSIPAAMTEQVVVPAKLANGIAGEDAEGSKHDPAVVRKRSRSASSSSSLSSAKSLDAETFAPTIEIDADAQVNGSRAAKSAGQRQAANRVAAGNASNKTRPPATALPRGPYSDFNATSKFTSSKHKKHRSEPDINPEELQKQRSELYDRSYHDHDLTPGAESNERTMLVSYRNDPPSLLTSIPPPVIHPHNVHPASATLSSPLEAQGPPDEALRNGTSRKRSRKELEDDEDAMETPASTSPAPHLAPATAGTTAPSRAGTPRVSKLPPTKKARKSARIMVS